MLIAWRADAAHAEPAQRWPSAHLHISFDARFLGANEEIEKNSTGMWLWIGRGIRGGIFEWFERRVVT